MKAVGYVGGAAIYSDHEVLERTFAGASPKEGRKKDLLIPGSQQGRSDGIASGWGNVTSVR